MGTLWPHTHDSLDNSVAQFSDSLAKLKAAQSVDLAEVTEQLKSALEAVRNLRSLAASVLPAATWQSREGFDAVVAQVQEVFDARARLLALAAELERGSVVHRRAARVEQMNQLREQAILELRAQTEIAGAPPRLPGPEPERWIEWACGLKEPEDTESLKALREGFAQLDEFVANLEPDMWVVSTETPV